MKSKYRLLFFLPILPLQAHGEISYVVRDSVQDCVNVRIESNPSSAIVDCLSANTPVTVIASVPSWRRITFNGSGGRIAKRFIVPIEQPPSSQDNLWLEVHFVDVGQGGAIWIVTPDDDIDGNGKFEGLNIVVEGQFTTCNNLPSRQPMPNVSLI